MQLGIAVAREVAAKRAGKTAASLTKDDLLTYGPTIIYNGSPPQNADLKRVLADGTLSNYPAEKFAILELPDDMRHSLGHFVCLQRAKDKIDLDGKTMALVTSAYHFPRVSRIKMGDYLGKQVKVIPFLHDRTFALPDAVGDMCGEIERIPLYIEKGHLGREASPVIDRGARQLGG